MREAGRAVDDGPVLSALQNYGPAGTTSTAARALALVPAMLVAVAQKDRVPAATPVMVQVRSVVGAQV